MLFAPWRPVALGAAAGDGQIFAINHIPNTNVLVGTPITIQIAVTNTTGANSQLTWSLNSSPATSATLTPTNTGPQDPTTFNWTPLQTQVRSLHRQRQPVYYAEHRGHELHRDRHQRGPPREPGCASTQSRPRPWRRGRRSPLPTMPTPPTTPTTLLVFSLLNAPGGATITNNSPTSGVFTWTPTAAQAATPSYTIREIVTEVSGSGSNYQDFQVTVTRTNDCAQLDEFLAAVQQGGYFLLSNCTTIVLTNTLTISKSVTLDGGPNNVTIAGNNLFRLFTVLPGVTNFTLRGLTLSGGQDDQRRQPSTSARARW